MQVDLHLCTKGLIQVHSTEEETKLNEHAFTEIFEPSKYLYLSLNRCKPINSDEFPQYLHQKKMCWVEVGKRQFA